MLPDSAREKRERESAYKDAGRRVVHTSVNFLRHPSVRSSRAAGVAGRQPPVRHELDGRPLQICNQLIIVRLTACSSAADSASAVRTRLDYNIAFAAALAFAALDIITSDSKGGRIAWC